MSSEKSRSKTFGTSLIFSTPYLLASKIEAFTSRGGGNFYFSSDIEDIVAVIDGRSNLFEEVQQADEEVKAFLSEWFRAEKSKSVRNRACFPLTRC